MNINRNNNRRRGRGNNRGPGGGNQSNRIDSRARGNAPQLLEKYRKLAHDASLNDDRVQTEYYLQFADHYFRVLADSKTPRDDNRSRRDHDDSDEDEQDEFGSYDSRPSERRGNDNSPRGSGGRDDSGQSQRANQRRRFDGSDDQHAQESRGKDARGSNDRGGDDRGENGAGGVKTNDEDNPFTRETPPRKPRGRPRKVVAEVGDDGLDPGTLPPAIARGIESEPATHNEDSKSDGDGGPAKPARAPRTTKPRTTRPRTRQSRPSDDGDGETLEAVS